MTTESEEQTSADGERQVPRVFLSYGSEDKKLAGQVASTLRGERIETWWDNWEIRAGDSIRQKVDNGIEKCTHFLVLLTKQSINKEWVKAEMDAGFVRNLRGQCRFIPVRYELPVNDLPPTLEGVLSPEIKSGTDLSGLVSDIYEMNKKPPLGNPPAAVVQAHEVDTGYSPAVLAVAKLLVEESKNGLTADPRATMGNIASATELEMADAEDAIRELEDYGFLKVDEFLGKRPSQYHVRTMPSLFVKFDRYFMGWNAEEDAVQIATDMVNDKKFPTSPEKIAKQYGWSHRRLNPALKYLVDEDVIHDTFAFGIQPLIISFVKANHSSAVRRFLREHQA